MAETQELTGVFIDVDVDDAVAADRELAAKLEEVCPVDIYAGAGGKVKVVRENLDECVLCNLCVEAAGIPVVERIDEIPGAVQERLR